VQEIVTPRRLKHTLRRRFGLEEFRPGQEEVSNAVFGGRDALVVMPTGGGKSLMYQLPALLLPGLTVVVSPLIALMKDQLDKLRVLGLDAWVLNSSLGAAEQTEVQTAIAEGRGKIVYITPERFRDRDFFELLLGRDISLFVVDEAHCLSQWGHDFRPDYMMLGAIIERLGRPPILAVTATAGPEVQDDVIAQLGMRDPFRLTLDLIRPNLFLDVLRTVNEEAKDAALERILEETEGTGIVYVATVKEADRLHAQFSKQFPIALYHGKLGPRQRTEAQERFMSGEVRAVIATNAFGLGIDKPDIRFVTHYHFPGSPDAYYQEAGRAGRDGERARCTILYRFEDRNVQSYFLGGKYPSIEDAAKVATVLAHVPTTERRHLDDIAKAADVPRRKARIVLTLFKRRGGMREHRGGEWQRVAPDLRQLDLSNDIVDYEGRGARDRENLQAMVGYCQTAQCRTAQLLEYFGGDVAEDHRCGHCDNCVAPPETSEFEPETVRTIVVEEQLIGATLDEAGRFQLGQSVAHPSFGTGKVEAMRGANIDVRFSPRKLKTIREEFLRPV
jgi:ATP-dependent DNA helicase RecQ